MENPSDEWFSLKGYSGRVTLVEGLVLRVGFRFEGLVFCGFFGLGSAGCWLWFFILLALVKSCVLRGALRFL